MSSKNPAGPFLVSIPVVVSDRSASTDWYVHKLGLRLVDHDEHWVTVAGDQGSRIHLCQASENRPAPIPLEPGPSGMVFAISGDFVAERHRLKAAGVDFSHEPENAPWGWYATIRDPDGNEHYLAPAGPAE
jgi:catechol 2,3-dioxygenase-like lactoylglutathione lyase family enzyme